ncbi:MAG: hypothetical protein LBJ18_04375 [Rickettsiales bacterium]|jgi:hypothetical protein|nr:hypothetical protein [Rickettsiales bacterium]
MRTSSRTDGYSKTTLQKPTNEFPILIKKATNRENGAVSFSAAFEKNGKHIQLFKSAGPIDKIAQLGKSFVILRKKSNKGKYVLMLVDLNNGNMPFKHGASRIGYDFNENKLYITPLNINGEERPGITELFNLSGKNVIETIQSKYYEWPAKLKIWRASENPAQVAENTAQDTKDLEPVAPAQDAVLAPEATPAAKENVALDSADSAQILSELFAQILKTASPFIETICDIIADKVAAKINNSVKTTGYTPPQESSSSIEVPAPEIRPVEVKEVVKEPVVVAQKDSDQKQIYTSRNSDQDLYNLSIAQLQAKLYGLRNYCKKNGMILDKELEARLTAALKAKRIAEKAAKIPTAKPVIVEKPEEPKAAVVPVFTEAVYEKELEELTGAPAPVDIQEVAQTPVPVAEITPAAAPVAAKVAPVENSATVKKILHAANFSDVSIDGVIVLKDVYDVDMKLLFDGKLLDVKFEDVRAQKVIKGEHKLFTGDGKPYKNTLMQNYRLKSINYNPHLGRLVVYPDAPGSMQVYVEMKDIAASRTMIMETQNQL